jgi:hypothetical protein
MPRCARGVPPLALAPAWSAGPRADRLGLWIVLETPVTRTPGG